MSKWERVNLSELTECLDSRRIPVKENERLEGVIPYYGANGQVGWIDRAIFDEPLLLIAEDGGHFDDPEKGVAYVISGPSWVNNHAHVLRARPERVMLEFLGYYFRHFNFLPYITGSTRQKLNQKDLFKIGIPLPPLVEQERIVRILDKAEEMKRLRAQANARTADLIPALFDEMFGDPVRNEKGWEIKNIEDVCAKVTDGTHDTPEYIREGIPLVTSKNVANGKIDFSTAEFISKEDHKQIIKRSNPEPGDVLFGMIGTIGNTAIVPEEKSFSIKNVALFKKSEKVISTYLYSFLSHASFQKVLLADSRGGTQQFVGLGTLRSINIPLPPISLQSEFAARVEEIRSLELNQSAAEQTLESLFQSLSHRAFEGEL
jgi:type I restriction enzyme S subunit